MWVALSLALSLSLACSLCFFIILWSRPRLASFAYFLCSLFHFFDFKKEEEMSLIEISSDADGASFHSASSGSVEVVTLSPAASGEGGAAAMRPPPPPAANELTSARRSTRVRVPLVVRSPPPPPPPPRAAAARRTRAAADPGGGELSTRVKRQSVEEGRRAGGAGNVASDEGATGATHLFRFDGGDFQQAPRLSLTTFSSFFTS